MTRALHHLNIFSAVTKGVDCLVLGVADAVGQPRGVARFPPSTRTVQ